MRFVGPITPGLIEGEATPIKELAWMLERIGLFVERQLKADGFHGLEVTLIPTVGDQLVVSAFKNRESRHAYEKAQISIPDDLQSSLRSPSGEEIALKVVPRSSCEQGLYVTSVGRLD